MLILASASQSRKKLLENCQIEFIQKSSNFDETAIKEKNIFNLALELSFQKANSISENIQQKLLPEEFNFGPLAILGCDSIFEFKGEAYGKPSNKEEAIYRWEKMSGESGSLHTGHTLLIGIIDSTSKMFKITETIKQTVSSRVYFSKLEDWEIKSVCPVCKKPNCPDIFFHLLNASSLSNGFPKALPLNSNIESHPRISKEL